MSTDTHGTRVLFAFVGEPAEWRAVNDGVMGGISAGRFVITANGTLLFSGTLSLANNGGFASVRSNPRALDLTTGDVLLARVRGDGREYSLNLYTDRPRTAFSYRAAVPTIPGEWVEVRVPLDRFVATSFGRVVADLGPVDPAEVHAIGFMLADRTAGSFEMEVEWIRVAPAAP